MKNFKVVANNLYGSINENEEVKGFEQWEKIIIGNTKEELINMISKNHQIISIEEVNFLLTDNEKEQLLKRTTINKLTDDKTIEIIYNKIFGNPQYDSFICLSKDKINEIRDFMENQQTYFIVNNLLK